jgi:hypothetical protein
MLPVRFYCPAASVLESGGTLWCQILDALRLGPTDDVAEVTSVQVRRVVEDLIDMGRWHAGDRDILVVFDAGYDAPAYLLEGVPVEVLGSTTPVNSPSSKEH